MRRLLIVPVLVVALAQVGLRCGSGGGPGSVLDLPGLQDEVRVVIDRFGVPHLFAKNDLDLARVQGWIQARDRIWQLDVTRRQVDGTLAELLGPAYVDDDIQMRTIGLQRAAARSLAALDPETVAVIQAFSEGVNAWIDQAEASGDLPPEYAQVEITKLRRWDPVDTVGIGKGLAASLSLDIDAGLREDLEEYVDAGTANGFDGAALFYDDIERAAPMDPASMVPDATGTVPFDVASRALPPAPRAPGAGAAVREWALRNPLLALAVDRSHGVVGSNEWGVTAEHTTTGTPIYANDPHLSLDNPATFHEIHLVVENDPTNGPLNVHGVSVPGAPLVVQGQNERITFGSTTNPMDVTDLFEDELVAGDPACTGARKLCIRTEGRLEPVQFELATYQVNQIGDGVNDNLGLAQIPIESGFIFTVPFRSFGPIVFVADTDVILSGTGTTTALVLQFTGFHATTEIETFRVWARAHDLATFEQGLQHFDFGSQNWGYADADGNLAVYTSGELPLRKDLEAGGDPACMAPYFVRDGSGPCNWVPDPAHSQGQTIPFAVLPFDEMPKAVNPVNGFVVNANNDPAGVTLDNDPLNQFRKSNPQAIYYLNGSYDEGLRAGRITRLVKGRIDAGEKISIDDMKRFQGNTQQLDAELMVPFLLAAWTNATRAGAPPALAAYAADPALAEAVARLADWDFSTPTGIPEGYDASDTDGVHTSYVPSYEARASVAATIYNVWRAKAIRAVIDATLSRYGLGTGSGQALKSLHHLLSQSPFSGVGASGVDFFPEPAALASATDRRDATLLAALRTALDALASDAFANAFGHSTNQDDYRWGRLHRITFDHILGGSFSIPPSAGFTDLSPALPGIARDGGYDVVNASGFSARADRENDFRFGGGPNRRHVGAPGTGVRTGAEVVGFNVIPGGTSARENNATYAIQLPTWLTADYHPMEMFEDEARRGALGVQTFRPPAP